MKSKEKCAIYARFFLLIGSNALHSLHSNANRVLRKKVWNCLTREGRIIAKLRHDTLQYYGGEQR